MLRKYIRKKILITHHNYIVQVFKISYTFIIIINNFMLAYNFEKL